MSFTWWPEIDYTALASALHHTLQRQSSLVVIESVERLTVSVNAVFKELHGQQNRGLWYEKWIYLNQFQELVY